MANVLPKFLPGALKTNTATAAVTGGTLVESTGARTVGPAADGSTKVVGYALRDAAIGEQTNVTRLTTVMLEADGAIGDGQRICAAADGKARAYDDGVADTPDMIVGYACEDVADAATGEFNLTI